jgi:hypothetical protein
MEEDRTTRKNTSTGDDHPAASQRQQCGPDRLSERCDEKRARPAASVSAPGPEDAGPGA